MSAILVASDLSARSDRAVVRAAAIARARGVGLHLLTVVDDDRPNEMVLAEEANARAALEMQASRLEGLETRVFVETGHPAIMIPKMAIQCEAALVVMGAHRNRGLSDVFGRPNLARLLLGLDRPALVVVGRPEQAYGSVLVGWDFSPAGEAAAACAHDLAPGAQVTLGHAMALPDMGMAHATMAMADYTQAEHERQEAALVEAAAAMPGKPSTDMRIGGPGPTLARMAEDLGSDLLAVGRHARGPLARLIMGETAMTLALTAPCDVLITPPS